MIHNHCASKKYRHYLTKVAQESALSKQEILDGIEKKQNYSGNP